MKMETRGFQPAPALFRRAIFCLGALVRFAVLTSEATRRRATIVNDEGEAVRHSLEVNPRQLVPSTFGHISRIRLIHIFLRPMYHVSARVDMNVAIPGGADQSAIESG